MEKPGKKDKPIFNHTNGKVRPLRDFQFGFIFLTLPIFSSPNAGMDLAVECDTHMVKYTYPLKPDDGEGSFQGFIRDNLNGTVFIGEGSWGAPKRPVDDDKPWTLASDSFWQFKLIHADSESLKIRTIRFEDTASVDAVVSLTQTGQDNALTVILTKMALLQFLMPGNW